MPFCPKCGAAYNERDKFCGKCGNEFSIESSKVSDTTKISEISEKERKSYELWVKRGRRGRLFCFIPCFLLPPVGYYFAADGWRGVIITVIINVLTTIAGIYGDTYVILLYIAFLIFVWWDLGLIISKFKLIETGGE